MMQEWFRKAKLGIFIHWGIYSVQGVPESWSIGKGLMSYDEYMKQLDGFTAENYDPEKWAELFKKAGANYAVLTTKHHDGVALFDTEYTDCNVVKKTPAGRDLVAPYCNALRNKGIKVGLYFTNTDWSDADHLSVVLDKSKEEVLDLRNKAVSYHQMWSKVVSRENDGEPLPEQKEAWERFMTRYEGEMRELLTKYGDIDLLWFDGMLERKGFSWRCKENKEMINSIQPHTIVNSRLTGYGDYENPEMYIPLRPLDGPWELCTTFNDSWGFRFDDDNYKTVAQLVRMFVECISKGGNMLISAGPNAKGEIPAEQERLMLELGEWTGRYAEAIYPTGKGIEPEYFKGGSTLSEDKKTLYLFVYDRPNEKIMLNGIRNKIKRVTSLAGGRELKHTVTGGAHWLNIPGCIWIDINDEDLDPVCTVLKVELEGEIDLVALKENRQSLGEM